MEYAEIWKLREQSISGGSPDVLTFRKNIDITNVDTIGDIDEFLDRFSRYVADVPGSEDSVDFDENVIELTADAESVDDSDGIVESVEGALEEIAEDTTEIEDVTETIEGGVVEVGELDLERVDNIQGADEPPDPNIVEAYEPSNIKEIGYEEKAKELTDIMKQTERINKVPPKPKPKPKELYDDINNLVNKFKEFTQ